MPSVRKGTPERHARRISRHLGAISYRLFHWQSQSTTSPESPTGQRYTHHRQPGHSILLAVRENRSGNGLSCPFFFGAADYVSHVGARPMSITWRLQHPLYRPLC